MGSRVKGFSEDMKIAHVPVVCTYMVIAMKQVMWKSSRGSQLVKGLDIVQLTGKGSPHSAVTWYKLLTVELACKDKGLAG